MTTVFINIGAGALHEGTKEQAIANVKALLAQVNLKRPAVVVSGPGRPSGGRWPFTLRRGRAKARVEMPGIPWAELGLIRLYVDGSSWMWKYAVSMTRAALADHDGKMQARYDARERRASREIKRQPTCVVCGIERTVYIVACKEMPGEDDFKVSCSECDRPPSNAIREPLEPAPRK